MRNYPTEQYELEELKTLNAEDWQVALLKLNPEYTCWGPHEDYMISKGGWNEPQFFDSWRAFGPWGLDELNELVNFYFELDRESHECTHCEGSGYNKETLKLYKSWYGELYDVPKEELWRHKLTKHEVKALWDGGRLFNFKTLPTPKEVNLQYGTGLGHDCINCSICVRARAEKLGVYGKCTVCKGRGQVFDAPEARVNLVLWFLHPRKGCSRGVEIKNITKKDVPAVINYLQSAERRNTARFSKLLTL